MDFKDIRLGEVYWDNYHKCLIKVTDYSEKDKVYFYDDLTEDFDGVRAQDVDLYPSEAQDFYHVGNLTKLLFLGDQCNP